MSILIPGHSANNQDNSNFIITRSGKKVLCESLRPFDSNLMMIRGQELVRNRPALQIRSVSPFPYNCVGMLFASRRKWIEIDYIYELFEGDGYRNIPNHNAIIGDIVVYKRDNEATHVAMIIYIDRAIRGNILVISKWGKDAEFIHPIKQVPELFGKPIEYWTDRSNDIK